MLDGLRKLLGTAEHNIEGHLINFVNNNNGAYKTHEVPGFKPEAYQPNDVHSRAVEYFSQLNRQNNANEIAQADQQRGFSMAGLAKSAPLVVTPRSSLRGLLQSSYSQPINPIQARVQPQSYQSIQGYGDQDAVDSIQGSWRNPQQASVRNLIGR